tara:strand:- start:31 stop:342 length:312 start_codon:yes stop_codon:yes gene_type:complete
MNKINKTLAIAILFSPAPAGLEPLGAERCSVCHGIGLYSSPHVGMGGPPMVMACFHCEEGTGRLDLLLDGLFETHREADLAADLFVLQNEQELLDRINELHAA